MNWSPIYSFLLSEKSMDIVMRQFLLIAPGSFRD